MSNKLIDNKELMLEYDYLRNKDIKLDTITLGSHKKIWWKCKKGHEWEKSVHERSNGLGCPYCSNKKVLKGYNDLATTNPELLIEWDYSKNTISPYEITAGSEKKAWWICSRGHSYYSYISNRKKGVGCPYCDSKKVLAGYNDLATTNPNLAKEWNFEKNVNLKPTDVTKGSKKSVWWKCKNGHEWEATIKSRNRGLNCPYCSNKKVLLGYNDLYTYCINNHLENIIDEFDNNKNKFTMKDITAGSDVETWWKCPQGHSYKSSPHRRVLRGSGCGICSHNILKKGENDLLTTNPEIAREWDYEKNDVRPDEVMAGSNIKKYWFICPKGHSYQTTILGRKRGTNCPQCNIENHSSFPERAIYYYMKKYIKDVIDSYHNSIIGRKEIDIFLPEWKLGIEYDGRAWHKNYKRDIEKDKICSENGILLFRIREIGCKDYESDSIKKYITAYNMQELNEVILYIFNYLNNHFKLKIKADVDVDRDKTQILELMNLSEKENSIANYCPDIKKYWDDNKNGKIQPEQISHGSEKKVFLKCEKGHEWEKTVCNISSTIKCPYCFGRKVLTGYNDLFTTNPELIPLWSPNNTLDPKTLKKGSNKKALWICEKCNKEYEMKINNKRTGKLCPECLQKRRKYEFKQYKENNI